MWLRAWLLDPDSLGLNPSSVCLPSAWPWAGYWTSLCLFPHLCSGAIMIATVSWRRVNTWSSTPNGAWLMVLAISKYQLWLLLCLRLYILLPERYSGANEADFHGLIIPEFVVPPFSFFLQALFSHLPIYFHIFPTQCGRQLSNTIYVEAALSLPPALGICQLVKSKSHIQKYFKM